MTNFTDEHLTKKYPNEMCGYTMTRMIREGILEYASRLREEIKPIINRIRIRLSFEERDQIIEEELQRLQSLLPPNQGEEKGKE